MVQSGAERRRQPRVAGPEGLYLRAGEARCRVLDISCSGVRFVTSEPPPLMSLVDIRLEVPSPDAPPPHGESGWLHCQGAVVRTETFGDNASDLEVAVFFTQIDDADRVRLAEYVRRIS